MVLLRDGAAGLEVWLLRRVRQMAFAAGMSVFPGGRVDPSDADAAGRLGRRRRSRTWPRAFDVRRAAGPRLVGAAVRETFEETGVLLPDRPPRSRRP